MSQNNCWNEKIFYANQYACWKKATCIFTKTFAKKRQADFENLAKPTTNKAEATKQSQSKPPQTEMQAKNLEADFSDSTKPTWTFANAETTANEKAENLKTCLLKKILTKTAYLKSATAKNKLTLWIENYHAEKNILAKNETCEPKTYLVLLLGCLTVCVTRAGADGGTPSEVENDKA